MVKYQLASLDRTFAALADPTRRALLARFVLEHRLSPRDPLALPDDRWEQGAIALVLDDAPATAAQVAKLLEA